MKKKERRERLKKEGKLLTDKQKQDRLRFQQTLEALKARGVAVPGSAAPDAAAATGPASAADAPDAAAKKTRPKYEKLKKRPQGQSTAGTGGTQEADAAPADETEQAPPEDQTAIASDAPKDDGIVDSWDQVTGMIYKLQYFHIVLRIGYTFA